MTWALIDDSGRIRGLWAEPQWAVEPRDGKPGVPRLIDVDDGEPRALAELADDDPRVLARLNPLEPVREKPVTAADLDAARTELAQACRAAAAAGDRGALLALADQLDQKR